MDSFLHLNAKILTVFCLLATLYGCSSPRGVVTETTTTKVTRYDFSEAIIGDGIAYLPGMNVTGEQAVQAVQAFQEKYNVTVSSWAIDRGGSDGDFYGIVVTYTQNVE